MLELHLERPALSKPWQAGTGGWSSGESRVAPFRHPAVEAVAFEAGGRLLFVARERLNGHSPASGGPVPEIEPVSPERFGAELRESLQWPLQSTTLCIEPGEPRATLRGGPWGTAPLFLVDGGAELWGHWDPGALYARLRRRTLDPVLAAHFLARFDMPYSRRTLVEELWMLSERATGTWSPSADGPGGLRISYPEAMAAPRPRSLKPAADVLGAFWEILTCSLQRWLPEAPHALGAELSGGLDSALAAAAAAHLGGPVKTWGLALAGEDGLDQAERRRALVQHFGFLDTDFDLSRAPPLAPGSVRLGARPFVPWEECYYEAVDELLARAARGGCALLATGFGGDELCAMGWDELAPEEREATRATPASVELPPFVSARTREAVLDTLSALDRAPRSSIPASAIESAAHGSSLYLRRGVWPVHPLCTPELSQFCRSLPRDWREGRRVERELLARLGCPAQVTHPRTIDDFSPALVESLRGPARPLVERLFRESRLAELGYVDRRSLLDSYEHFCAGGGDGESESEVPYYSAAALELTLRSLAGERLEGVDT